MPYEPTNWKSGDVVTSAKLNKLEQGVVAASAFLVHVTQESFDEGTGDITYSSDKTVEEVYHAWQAGKTVNVIDEYGGIFDLQDVDTDDDGGYSLTFQRTAIGAYDSATSKLDFSWCQCTFERRVEGEGSDEIYDAVFGFDHLVYLSATES